MAMFDAAHNRLSYSELLMPEPGYVLEFAVGLTYSLDLEALLGILHQNPARIKELSDVIKRLDSDIVGDDFMAMYSQFEMAARRLKK